MRDVPSWNEYWMKEAFGAAERSKDPSTQVGAAIVDAENNAIIMTGYNGFAPGAPESVALWTNRDDKYPRVIHAEENAICRSARLGRATGGSILFCTHFPCAPCAKLIAAAGITRVIAAQVMQRWNPEEAQARLAEAGIPWVVNDYGCLKGQSA
jgi:dCMP deaminase